MLTTVYLIFNAGYGPPVRAGLCAEAIRLGRVLVALMPDEGEAIGLLALMLLQDSRRDARVDAEGHLVLLPDQDRSRWDFVAIAEGERLVARAWRLGRLGVYLVQASIAVQHSRGSDWARSSGSMTSSTRSRRRRSSRSTARSRSPSATGRRRGWP